MTYALAVLDVPSDKMEILATWTKMPPFKEINDLMVKKVATLVNKPDWNHSNIVFSFMEPNMKAAKTLRDNLIHVLINEYMGKPLPEDEELRKKRQADTAEITLIMIEDLMKTPTGRMQLEQLAEVFPEMKSLLDVVKK